LKRKKKNVSTQLFSKSHCMSSIYC
jgi:hypothetical protein